MACLIRKFRENPNLGYKIQDTIVLDRLGLSASVLADRIPQQSIPKGIPWSWG